MSEYFTPKICVAAYSGRMEIKMKKIIASVTLLLIILSILTGCGAGDVGGVNKIPPCEEHSDSDDNGICDKCKISLLVSLDFYAVNDLHGKFKDTASNVGVDELTTYFRLKSLSDDNIILLSSGDMWQGSSESNLTKGKIITEWMNYLGFEAMTLGNHEYDWGEEYIKANDEAADFPFLAINVFDADTDERVEYCDASVIVEREGIQIGIIGAIGDCYSSISGDKSSGFYIKTGSDLTALVKAESDKLRGAGADIIVYSIHDGHDRSSSGEKLITNSALAAYYDISLSDGYVDLVFEGHTHQSYVLEDTYGVHHLQNGGENKGISYAELKFNKVTGTVRTGTTQFIPASIYSKNSDDAIVEELLNKYEEEIALGDVVLGSLTKKLYSDEIKSIVARLYYEYGMEIWSDRYDIALGGGFISTRNPYDLSAGEVRYSDVQSILPFDNDLVLCSIKGYDLKYRFFETDNSNYYIYYGSYGEDIRDNIDLNATYYIVTDTYSSSYASNNLTEVIRVDEEIFARDLFAAYIKNGGLK